MDELFYNLTKAERLVSRQTHLFNPEPIKQMLAEIEQKLSLLEEDEQVTFTELKNVVENNVRWIEF